MVEGALGMLVESLGERPQGLAEVHPFVREPPGIMNAAVTCPRENSTS